MRDDSVVICSSPYDSDTTRALVRYVRARFAPARIIAINTHFHADGTASNEGYAAEGVETYASVHTVKLQAERGREHTWLDYGPSALAALVLPCSLAQLGTLRGVLGQRQGALTRVQRLAEAAKLAEPMRVHTGQQRILT